MSAPQGTSLLESAAVADAATRPAPSRRSRRGRAPAPGAGRIDRDNRTAYLMLAPIVVLLGVFVIAPFVNAAYISFFDWSFYLPSQFVGLQNYVNIATDPDFLASVGRGLVFALIVVPVTMVLAFVFASVVRGMGRRLSSVVKTSIYIPTIMSGVIASIIFTIIYDYSGGVLNAFLGVFGVAPVAWLADPAVALPALTVPAIWIGFGVTALIMLAGMLDIPETYYEAASLEGVSWWQQTVYITVPLLKNVILYLLVAGFTAAIQQFEIPLVMTQGGPLNATLLPNLYIFNHFTEDERQGPAIAAALLLFLVLGAISAVIFRVLNSDKSIEG